MYPTCHKCSKTHGILTNLLSVLVTAAVYSATLRTKNQGLFTPPLRDLRWYTSGPVDWVQKLRSIHTAAPWPSLATSAPANWVQKLRSVHIAAPWPSLVHECPSGLSPKIKVYSHRRSVTFVGTRVSQWVESKIQGLFTQLLRDLHRPRVPQRIESKLAIVASCCLHCVAPKYHASCAMRQTSVVDGDFASSKYQCLRSAWHLQRSPRPLAGFSRPTKGR